MLGCGAPTHLPNLLHFLPHLIPLTFPYISPFLRHTPTHFPTPPLIPLPISSLPPPTPQHIFLLSPHLPSPSQSVVKLPCDEVSVAKLLWQSYWQPLKACYKTRHKRLDPDTGLHIKNETKINKQKISVYSVDKHSYPKKY